jgi:HEAT repeat protein
MRHPDRILHIIDLLGTEDRISRYLNSLNLGYTGSVKDIVSFFASLPKKAFPILLYQINIISSPQLRKEISIAVSQLYDYELAHFNKAFKTIKSPQHLIDILFILSHTRDARVADHMQPLFASNNRTIRLAAINTLRDLEVKNTTPLLTGFIDDEDNEIRLNAIRGLSQSTDLDVGRLLLEKIKNADFSTMPLAEKRTYFFTTAKILKDEFVPYLRQLLNSSNFFKRQQMDEIYQCAAHALSVVGSELAISELRNFEKNGNRTVRLHCAKELKRGATA